MENFIFCAVMPCTDAQQVAQLKMDTLERICSVETYNAFYVRIKTDNQIKLKQLFWKEKERDLHVVKMVSHSIGEKVP